MSNSPGKDFEKDFKDSIPERCDVTRLKDAGGWSNATNMRFTSPNPCDIIIYSGRSGAMRKLELKSFHGKSMPYGNIKQKKEKRIKFVSDLVESQRKGVSAGFVLNFRDLNETYLVSALDLKNYMEAADRQSFPLDAARKWGRLIKQTLKIKHYRYDLEWL